MRFRIVLLGVALLGVSSCSFESGLSDVGEACDVTSDDTEACLSSLLCVAQAGEGGVCVDVADNALCSESLDTEDFCGCADVATFCDSGVLESCRQFGTRATVECGTDA